ncbi:hypothetical protein AYO40_01525 [Planctomycetaceae bacterium SCGC AG-212-D15]|nr:hypothetical protein AYO40_01525 [Planctomycetaceae bacterium SCGC AG-212-D15]
MNPPAKSAASALLLVLVVGCGAREGTVSGRVLLNGEPLPGGRITFRAADPYKNSVNAEVDEDGTYEAVLPVGDVAVSVDNRDLQPRPNVVSLPRDVPLPDDVRAKLAVSRRPAAAPVSTKAGGRYVAIPPAYYDMTTSGLGFTVSGGPQTHDLRLER